MEMGQNDGKPWPLRLQDRTTTATRPQTHTDLHKEGRGSGWKEGRRRRIPGVRGTSNRDVT